MGMSTCAKCKNDLPDESFYHHGGRRSSYCKTCKKMNVKYRRENPLPPYIPHPKNHEERLEYYRDRNKRIRNFLDEYKSKHPCQCGEDDFRCLEFHHTDPTQKEYTVGQMVKHSMKLILAEIAKCKVMCSNCHKKLHHPI
jgi:hypothetical protein